MLLGNIARHLNSYLYRYADEVQLHESMAKVLSDAGIDFVREYSLDAQNRADFWIDGIVIEVKVDGPMSKALRQVDRYINLPQVTGLILASTQRWASDPLVERPAWNGKAFQMVRLGRQCL